MEEVQEAKKKPGPQPKPRVEFEDVQALVDKIDALERVLAKMAHNTGTPNSLFLENGLKPYELQARDMKKYN